MKKAQDITLVVRDGGRLPVGRERGKRTLDKDEIKEAFLELSLGEMIELLEEIGFQIEKSP